MLFLVLIERYGVVYANKEKVRGSKRDLLVYCHSYSIVIHNSTRVLIAVDTSNESSKVLSQIVILDLGIFFNFWKLVFSLCDAWVL